MAELDAVLARLKTLHPLMIDLSLGRVERLLARLGNPQDRFAPVIHVAGTNGKGSTTAFLKAMLEAAGRRVHVYTSPHLVRFAERIAVPGADGVAGPIDDRRLTALLERVEAVNGGEPITFFEVTMAAAFVAFAETPADAVLLEVGLGGAFDSTNVVQHPALCVITPIAMDHADKLGGTLATIAEAKAGILKKAALCVVAMQDPEPMSVIRARADAIGAPLTVWGEDFDAFEQRGRLVYQSEDELLDLPMPALHGRHQIINAGAAIAAARRLPPPLQVSDTAIARGLVDVRWPARMQRLEGGPLRARLAADAELWLDGGHNPHGGRAIAQTVADLEDRAPKPLVLIVGMMGQKDVEGFLSPFRGLAQRIITVPVPGAHERPHEPAALAQTALQLGFTVETATGVPAALDRLRATVTGPVRILICGSLYLAGHVLALQEGAQAQSN